MATVRCWNCNAENDPMATSGFCDRCGRKLEDVPETGIADAPARRREPDDVRSRSAGDYDPDRDFRDPYAGSFRRSDDSEEARKALNQASIPLFVVAGLQLICGTMVLLAAPAALGLVGEVLLFVFLFVFGLGVAFLGLGVWARYQPLPPAIIGLVLYILVFIADIVMSIRGGSAAFAILFRALVIIFLAKGIQGANKYNQLQSPRDSY